jgi:hypothetical protein
MPGGRYSVDDDQGQENYRTSDQESHGAQSSKDIHNSFVLFYDATLRWGVRGAITMFA